MKQYIRNARVRIGSDSSLNKEYVGFRVTFRIEKTIESLPNTSLITLYNLNEDSRARAEVKDALVSLEVGYQNELELIFFGNIARVGTSMQGTDLITELECGDGEKAFKEATIEQTFPAGANSGDILKTLAAKFREIKNGGVTSFKNYVVDTVKTFANGFAMSGSVQAEMDALAKNLNAHWSIQDGELQILPLDESTGENAFLISPKTGLIGSPGKLKQQEGEEQKNGVQFECLLQPRLKPGRLVRIESVGLTGEFKVTKVTHEGDTHTGTWLSKCEGVSL